MSPDTQVPAISERFKYWALGCNAKAASWAIALEQMMAILLELELYKYICRGGDGIFVTSRGEMRRYRHT